MMILLLFLASCLSTGFSYRREYGSDFEMLLYSSAKYIEFKRTDGSDQTSIVWERDGSSAGEGRRGKMEGTYFVIKKVTQFDSGVYIARDINDRKLSSKSLEVYEKKVSIKRRASEELSVDFDLEPKSCNIYFFPEEDNEEHTVARRGKQTETLYCQGLKLLQPCGFENNNLKMSCSGRFEFRDLYENNALVVTLIIEPPPSNKSYYGIGAGVFSIVLSCCCCLKRVCCQKSSSKKDGESETPNDDEPPVYYHEYENEPVGPQPEQLSPPSYTPTVLQVHTPPTTGDPPAFSEVYPEAQQEDVPTVPVLSDPEPQYELKGLTFPSAPPLSSDSTCCDVYTSDKLNFL